MSSLVPTRDRRAAAGLGILSIFVLGVAVWLVGAAVLPGLLPGWRSVVVTSGSMEPKISAGDVVVVAAEGPGVEVGSVVLFSTPEGPVTHRITGVNVDGTYITRGDANDADDSTPLEASRIVGRARFVIPNAGLPTLWWQQRAWFPLLATVLLLGVTAAALAVALDVWHLSGVRRPTRVGSGRAVVTLAAVALCVATATTSTHTQTARAAFTGSSANGTSRFVGGTYPRYRLLSDGPGNRNANWLLPLSGPTGAPTNAGATPNYDQDRNADPGLTLLPSAAGLAETDPNSVEYWYQLVPSGGITFTGRTRVRVWSAVRAFNPTLRGELVGAVYDCVVWPITCTMLGSGTVSAAPWNGGAGGWRNTVIDLGSISRFLPAGHYLAVQVVAGGGAQDAMWLSYDTTAHPAALELLP